MVELVACAFAAEVEVASCTIADEVVLTTAGAGSETAGSELLSIMGAARTALESTRAEKMGAKIRTIVKTLRTKETRAKVIRVQKNAEEREKSRKDNGYALCCPHRGNEWIE